MSFGHSGWGSEPTASNPGLWRQAWLNTSQAATILVVDDDAVVAEMYRIALVRGGYNVLVAKDGSTGLQMASASAPALIFLDIRMPRMDGIEVLEHLMADDKMRQIPVVMLSNYDDSTYIKRCMGLGAKEYVVKVSIRPAELATIASRWIKPPGA
jgi:chemosensory pili system protein ChpA (sensor histidine kinase/response regulator)